MVGRKRVSAVNKASVEDEFVSGEQFKFEVASPAGRVTRSRRSSICLNKPPIQTKGRKRMSLMPVVEEKPKPATNRRKSMAPTSKVAASKKTVSKGIELKNFYSTPEKKVSKRRSVAPNLKLAPSPKKIVRKNAGISDTDILESLDEMFDKTPPADGKRPAKTFETEAPEKTKPRRATIHLSSPIVAMSKEQMNKSKKCPVKQEAKTSAKASKTKTPVKAKTPTKSPLKAKTPAKAKTPKKSQEASDKVTKKTPAKAAKKTPARSSRKALRTPAKSPKETKFETMLNDMQAVQVRLDKLDPKVVEDPNTIFSHLEVEPASPERVSIVVEKILKARTPRTKTPAKSSLKRKGTESSEPIKSKRARLESPKQTPKEKTPSAEAKKTPKTAPRKVLIARKKTPGRLPPPSKAVATPAHVNPAKLLRRNMKGKVETAIVKKIAQKPDSSPYLLTGESEKSPKFERVNEQNEQVEVKTHITGTPVQVSRRRGAGRKFGTVIQPSLLALESPVPLTTTVKSSTPLRAGQRQLLDSEATPIRAPKEQEEAPLSPAPEMVTGGLAKLCAIM